MSAQQEKFQLNPKAMEFVPRRKKYYTVEVASLNIATTQFLERGDISVYTDGSINFSQKTAGAGFVIYCGNIPIGMFSVPCEASNSFQAEAKAISLAAKACAKIQGTLNKRVKIFCDNRAVLNSLSRVEDCSIVKDGDDVLHDTAEALRSLGQVSKSVTLVKIKAHVGEAEEKEDLYQGNRFADTLAKMASGVRLRHPMSCRLIMA